MSSIRHVVASALTMFVLGATVEAGNWPQWRGPDGQGVSDERRCPRRGADRNIAWKTAIPGRGHSSPIVWGNGVFLTTAVEGDVLPGAKAPIHYSRRTRTSRPRCSCIPTRSARTRSTPAGHRARPRHRQGVLGASRLRGCRLRQSPQGGSYASPTPVTDGKLVYAYFGSEGLYAYDFAGTLKWKADVGDIPTLGMGTSTSPVLYKNLVILQCDEDNGDESFILALDARTGKQVWKTPRDVE